MRIFGPCKSARIPIARPFSAAATRAASARRRCSSPLPCEKFRRTTLTPASINSPSTPGLSVAGPRVATIFVLRSMRVKLAQLRNQSAPADSATTTRPLVPVRAARAANASGECLQAGLRTSQNQRMHILRAFVGVDGLQVHDVADDVIFVADAVAAMHVPSHARDVESLAAVVAFDQGNPLRCPVTVVKQPGDAQAGLQAQRNLRLHVGQFFLHQLCSRQRPAELVALQGVVACLLPTEFGGTKRAPADAVTGLV